MNSKTQTRIIALTLLAALAILGPLAAQDIEKPHHPHQYHHYQLFDVGTFCGPQSWQWAPGFFRPGVLNNQGTLAGAADTATVDPYCFDYPDCYAINAFQWRDGITADLGVLPGGIDSQVSWVSGNGLIAGASDNGQQDPLNPAFPQLHAVLWDHGQMTDLGTLPEGGYSTGSWAAAVNQRGEVAGQAYNAIPDPNSMFGYGYQSRAFRWQNGVMQDLGTLGTGTDAMAGLINERGQVAGWSYTSSNPNLDNLCFGNPLATGSFIWDKKNGMKDIGNLGGRSCTLAHDLNDRGQVIGGSDRPGEFQHPFVWDSGTGMTDLGTPDGGYGVALAINEHGEVVGLGEANGGPLDAILWRKSGGKWRMTDLGTFGGCAEGTSINASGQVLGDDGCAGLAFLWEDGGPMADLNTLVPPNSGLQLNEGHQINDRGEIALNAVDANGNNHSVLLIPCDENHADVEGCDYTLVDAAAAAQSATPRSIPNSTQSPVHSSRSKRFHSSAVGVGTATLTYQDSPVPDFKKPPPGFWVAATPLTPSPVNPGGSATSSVTSGYGTGVDTVTLSCSVQPSPALAPTCSFSPASYTFGGTPSTLTVSTFGPSGRLLSRPASGMLYALFLPIFGWAATGIGLGSNPSGRRRKLKAALLTCTLFSGLAFQFACGGKGSSGTPAGVYSVTVTATLPPGFIGASTASGLTTLTVQ